MKNAQLLNMNKNIAKEDMSSSKRLSEVLKTGQSRFPDKNELVKLKTKAIRAGVWFKTLRRIDRALYDLTVMVVRHIRSTKLAKSISALIGKLEEALTSFSSRLRSIGLPLLQKISLTAQKLGNASARSWLFDSAFANFLAVMHLNAKMRNR